MSHEISIIEWPLASDVDWLAQSAPNLAAALRAVLGYLATPQSARRRPGYVIAKIVEKLDELSAASSSQRDLVHLVGGAQVTGTPAASARDEAAEPAAIVPLPLAIPLWDANGQIIDPDDSLAAPAH